MILSSIDVLALIETGELVITPFLRESIQPASYDLHLHPEILVYASNHRIAQGDWLQLPYQELDADNSQHLVKQEIPDDGFLLFPNQCVLGRTHERFKFPKNVVGKLEGVSTNARIFLIVHSTAGHFDQAFEGTGTLEIINLSPRVTVLRRWARIAQMIFQYTTFEGEYDGRYQGQIDATPARSPRIR